MPMVYPNYGPGGGSGALDALRKVGSLDPTDGGGRMGINPHRLTEQLNGGVQPGQAATPTPILPLSNPPPQTPPAEDAHAPMAGLLRAMNGVQGRNPQTTPIMTGKTKQSWAGERNDG